MKFLITPFLILLTSVNLCSAQLVENFNDGNFTTNPTWSGDVSSFTVNPAFQLQSTNTTASSTFYLSTPSTAAVGAEWDLFVNLKFATSGANYVDVFLVSDIADVNNGGSGYFVRVGGTADEISLYRNDAGTGTKIIDGADSRIASSSNNIIKLKIIRDAANLWTLSDSIAAAIPVVNVEGTVTDNTYLISQYFGISVTQSTVSFFGKHYFDSIYAGPVIVDNISPQLINAAATSINTIDVLFNEPVDAITSQTLSNYIADKGIGLATTAATDIVNNALVHLSFGNNFIIDTTYTVTVTNVKDLAGNAITTNNTATFTYSAPKIDTVIAITQTSVDVKFTQNMQQASAENLTNYSINNGVGNPNTAILDAADSLLVHLTFATNFMDALLNTLTVNNILSVNNVMVAPNTTATFTWFAPVAALPNDIIINEIMAAPSGALGLPNAEYVELFNRSGKNLNLTGWTIHDATGSSGALQNIVIVPGSFLIICSSANVAALSIYGNTIGVSSFPSFNNNGDDIAIYDITSQKIDEIKYDTSWYHDPNKISNGYSLERIDANFPCPTSFNWAASIAVAGGTPGIVNSINSVLNDAVAPLVLNTANVTSQTVTIIFNEAMDSNSLNNVNGYSIDNGTGTPVSAIALPYSNEVTLQVAANFQPGVVYTITLNGVADCSGNMIANNTTTGFTYLLPTVSNVTVISQTAVDVKFTQDMQQNSAETVANYFVNNGTGNPSTAIRDAYDSSLVHLTFATNFTDGLINTLTLNNILGVNNASIAANTTIAFTWFAPVNAQRNDVIINEIMAIPNDLLALPNAEYIEIYNRSTKNINLSGWTLHDATSSSGSFQNTILAPGSYLIVCATAYAGGFTIYGNVIGVGSFPSLNNAGDDLLLYDNNAQLIDEVNYSDTWYRDADKAGGGYSLERIDKNFPCSAALNWGATTAAAGGTPGNQNSINGAYTDADAPKIKTATIYFPQSVTIIFDETVDLSTLTNVNAYTIDEGIGNPVSAVAAPYSNFVNLEFAGVFQKNIIYTLTLNGVKDCAGNTLASNTNIRIAIPDTAQPGDIVINEILFNSYSGGYDFVELYNNSDKVFDLSTLKIASADLKTDTLTYVYPITTESLLFFPGDYVAVTENPTATEKFYYSANSAGIIMIDNLPTFNDDEGIALVLNESSAIVDKFRYSATFQYPLINNVEGVSLERLSFTRPTQDSTNWQSAAATVGFATPAYKNSQAMESGSSTSSITITPEIFSPDDDGYNDVLSIHYLFNQPGLVANATVYDSRGRLIQYIARNVLIGEDATLSWNGINLNNEKAKVGIYVLYTETFTIDGDVKHYKNTFVLAGKLK